ncbi:MAG: ABC transporter ATP-binding protein [Cyclobacteriaceae bacterium]|nr:ABC transporter ATP-binding protein [Cyclobacteriaceae bacterium]
MSIAIKVEGLGKKYKIGRKKSGDLRESVGLLLDRFRKKGHSEVEQAEKEFWALKDVSFEIKQGEAVGVIGRNGAGKSTLLKILSRITEPTTGRVEINGRVSSLLEVGTGFHPELTGRENIFLNGTILGMRRREVRAKFDEIVDFSGVEKFIDTPIKHYSSGMKVRLAFSVAAHLEPEILLIDEVLAVGDAEFQKKCLGKMEDVAGQGRTVLFVSHNLAAVTQLCQEGILLSSGQLKTISEVNDAIHEYIAMNKIITGQEGLINLDLRKGNGQFKVKRIRNLDEKGNPVSMVNTGNQAIFEIFFNKKIHPEAAAFRIDFAIDNEQDVRVAWYSSDAINNELGKPFDTLYLKLPKFHLGRGTYYLTFYTTWKGDLVDYIHQGYSFEVEEGDYFGTGKIIPRSQTFIYSEHELYSN